MDDKKLKTKKKNEEEEVLVDAPLDQENKEVSESKEEVADLAAKVSELEDQLKRSVADYRNLENRNRDEKMEFVKFANKNLIEQLLPAFDTLLLAEKYSEDENLKITVKHLLEVLKSVGVEKIETVGRPYEAGTMEAIEVVEGKENEVVGEAQPGFTLYGKVIRPARVKVGGGEKEHS